MEKSLDNLATAWLAAKSAEAQAAKVRIDIEAQMLSMIEVPAEGAKTHKFDHHKITVMQPIGRKLDEAEWFKVRHHCPEGLQPVKVKMEADGVAMKYLQNNEPTLWAKIATAFETKPGKVGFKVEVI